MGILLNRTLFIMSGKRIPNHGGDRLTAVAGEGEEVAVHNLSDIPHPNHRSSSWLKENTRVVYLQTNSFPDGGLKRVKAWPGTVICLYGEGHGPAYSGKVLIHFDEVFNLHNVGDINDAFRITCDVNSPFLMLEEEVHYLIQHDFTAKWFEDLLPSPCAVLVEKSVVRQLGHQFGKHAYL